MHRPQQTQHLNSTRREKPMTNAINQLRAPRRTLTTLAVCLLAGAAAGAYAGTPDADSASVKVAYSDTDLATEQGSSALYARIVAAARQVCGAREVDGRDLAAMASARACQQQAIANAVQAVHSTKLAAVYDAHLHGG
jgi:UrcA family protein